MARPFSASGKFPSEPEGSMASEGSFSMGVGMAWEESPSRKAGRCLISSEREKGRSRTSTLVSERTTRMVVWLACPTRHPIMLLI